MAAVSRTAVAVATAAALVAACAGPAATAPPPTIAELPRDGTVLTLEDGTPTAIADIVGGRVVVLDFWASWCEQCRRSIPKLIRLAGAYPESDVVVVGINVGESAAVARRFMDDVGVEYTNYLDPELDFADRIGATSLPLLLVISPGGDVVHTGRVLDEDALAAIRSHVGR